MRAGGLRQWRAGGSGIRSAEALPYYNHFFKTSNPYTIELAAKLTSLLPEGHDRVLFANSGSEANDTALKLIRYYWNLQRKPEKKIHLSREYSYHGVTFAAASLSGLTPMHPQFDLPLPGFAKVAAPYWFGAQAAGHGDIGADEFGLLIAKKLEERILEIGPANVASFSAEPVQGAGGVIFPPDTYWPEVQRICKKYDVLLHLDEVITGFGRTGEWFGAYTYNIAPDIMTMAKGLSSGYQPISAISLGPRVGDALATADEELVHGYTYSGHPVASAVALRNLEVLEKEYLVRSRENRDRALSATPAARNLRRSSAGRRGARHWPARGHRARAGQNQSAAFSRAIPDVGSHCRNYCFKSGLVMPRHPRHDGAGPTLHHHRKRGGGDHRKSEIRDRPDGARFRKDVKWSCALSR